GNITDALGSALGADQLQGRADLNRFKDLVEQKGEASGWRGDVPRSWLFAVRGSDRAVTEREVWTIGHWTCPEELFLRPLRAQRIEMLVDVRSQPGSRRNPQFDREAMPAWLGRAGIAYRHVPELGGRRGRQDVDHSINAGWQQPAFKNYADYTLSQAYQQGIEQLAALATAHRVVIMCGEPMPWRCHRMLIAN